ncbi:hypothetical protein MPSD_51310 [Mycobacterium pseudoshottsii JCM 15466]|nr:hypothetical protein MPSD_51310 [Mycobacterium pseudoshottsii JCM 15466]
MTIGASTELRPATIGAGTPICSSGNSIGNVGDGIRYVVIVPPSEVVTLDTSTASDSEANDDVLWY